MLCINYSYSYSKRNYAGFSNIKNNQNILQQPTVKVLLLFSVRWTKYNKLLEVKQQQKFSKRCIKKMGNARIVFCFAAEANMTTRDFFIVVCHLVFLAV